MLKLRFGGAAMVKNSTAASNATIRAAIGVLNPTPQQNPVMVFRV